MLFRFPASVMDDTRQCRREPHRRASRSYSNPAKVFEGSVEHSIRKSLVEIKVNM